MLYKQIKRKTPSFTETHSLILIDDDSKLLVNIEKKVDRSILEKIPVAPGASFDSRMEEHNPTCLPNTRVDLLSMIDRWIDDPDSQPIFWLNGMAGTGKSTISRTIAKVLASQGRLSANFFFKRGEAGRGNMTRFFGTIAAQLVVRKPAIAPHLRGAIESDTALFDKTLKEQFENLVLRPLSSLHEVTRQHRPYVFIVDALDECEPDQDIQLLLELLSRTDTVTGLQIKIFVTSRPELPIRLGFSDIDGTFQECVLHQMPTSVVKQDITTFVSHELANIRKDYNKTVGRNRQLKDTWPGVESLEALVDMAVPLFIYAATICRLIADRRIASPEKQLQKVLHYRSRSHLSKLDITYAPVLDQLIEGLDDDDKEEVLQLFQGVVGSIISLAAPLSAQALARLTDIDEEDIDNILDSLHSVLNVPSSNQDPIRLLHLSFRDFLIDSKRGGSPFWVDEKEVHQNMIIRCLDVMDRHLVEDIASLKEPGTSSTASPCLDYRITALPEEAQYACLNWVHHVRHAGMQLMGDLEDVDVIFSFLHRHFLHWLEALSLLDEIDEAVSMLDTLREHVEVCKTSIVVS